MPEPPDKRGSNRIGRGAQPVVVSGTSRVALRRLSGEEVGSSRRFCHFSNSALVRTPPSRLKDFSQCVVSGGWMVLFASVSSVPQNTSANSSRGSRRLTQAIEWAKCGTDMAAAIIYAQGAG